MNNKYEKQDSHKTEKWGNIIPKEKMVESKYNSKQAPINNPFKDIFGDLFPGLKNIKK